MIYTLTRPPAKNAKTQQVYILRTKQSIFQKVNKRTRAFIKSPQADEL